MASINSIDGQRRTPNLLLAAVTVQSSRRRFWPPAIKILPVLTAVFRPQKRPVGLSWRMDETYIKVADQWKYLHRAFDRTDIQLRQSKYLNNIVEQDHRAIVRIVRPMLGFESFRCASIPIAGIETMHMIKKGQLDRPKAQASTAASQFYSLAF